jgi:hypothetical protein
MAVTMWIGRVNNRCFAQLFLESATQFGSLSVYEWMLSLVNSMRHTT